jgi:dTDP-4-dehydrorhamnose 3,5-epimerase-like enzyme
MTSTIHPTIDDCVTIQLPKIPDVRGNLTYIEGSTHVPFTMHRVYWIYDVPGGEVRGGHAYRELQEVLVAMSGSFDVTVRDGFRSKTVTLNRSYNGLYIPRMMWRQVGNFSTNAVCLVLASAAYDESDYIRHYDVLQTLRSAE